MKRHFRNLRLLAGSLVLYAALSATTVFGQTLVNIVSPVGSEPLVLGKSTQIVVTITDPVAAVVGVDIYANNDLIGSAQPGGERWVLNHTFDSLTPVTLRAEAIDAASSTWSSFDLQFDVIETDAPVVTILSPADGSSYLPGTNLPVQVQASDPDGLISDVTFFLNGIAVSTVGSAPFRTELQLPSIGSYELVARARDDLGVETLSDPISLVAGPPDEVSPRVVIDFPLPLGDGDTVNDVSYASSMFLNATVKDPDGGTIESVEFYINGQLLGEAENNIGDVYSLYYDPNALGSYVISTKAIDNDGNVGWSVPLVLDVGPLERPLPKATMVQPFPEILLGENTQLVVEATGGLISIERVDFFANGVFIGSADEPLVDELYSVNWSPQEPGDYDIQTRIVQIDPAGATWDNWTISSPVSTTVVEPQVTEVRTVAITQPGEDDQHTVLNPIGIQVDALDPLGIINSVNFYVNGTQVGSDDLYPYTIEYLPRSPGRYSFVAELNSTSKSLPLRSDPVVVQVVDSQLPSAKINFPLDGDAVSVGVPVYISATSTSTGGNDMELEFFANGVSIGKDANNKSPFNIMWTPQSVGQFALKVVAREPGTVVGIATSQEVNITVNPTELPVASIIEPGEKAPTVGSTVPFTVDASDSDGFVESVRFFVNGENPDSASDDEDSNLRQSSPFTYFWNPENPGLYTLSAVVTDNSGNEVFVSRQVTVVNPQGIVPRITMSVTGAGNVTPGSRVVVSANVFDDTPDELEVSFFLNGSQVGNVDSEPPYSVIVDPEGGLGPFGNAFELIALAEDPDGNSSLSRLFPLYVSDFSVDQPSIELLNIEEGDNFTRGSRVPIRVEVGGGAARNLANLVFYADGVEIGRMPGGEPSNRYTFDWLPTESGTVQITAASLLNEEFYDHDRDSGSVDSTPRIPVTPVNVAFPVNINVNEAIGNLPSISLDVFPGNENLAIGSRILVYADAQDLGGAVTQVEFFNDGVSVGVDTQAPFTQVLPTTRPGDFALNALATDSDGNVVTSTVVNLGVADRVVTRTPEISLTVPDSGQEGNPLSLRASVEGFVNGPESVIFFVNGQEVGQSDTPPYSYSWLANLEGTLTFFATAQQPLSDGTLITTVSEIVDSFLVDNLPPVIGSFGFTYPDADDPAKPNPELGDKVNFTVRMSDTSPIKTAELLRDGDVILTLDNPASPFQFEDVPPSVGLYEYSVVVTDRGALQTQSQSLAVTVDNPPLVIGGFSFTYPDADDPEKPNPEIGDTLNFTVSTSDASPISLAELLRDGEVVSTLDNPVSPFLLKDTPPQVGRYSYSVRVTDEGSNQVRSKTISVTLVEVDDEGELILPEILSFTSDVNGDSSLVNLPIRLTARATDEEGIGRVDFLREGVVFATVFSAPYEVEFIPTAAGNYNFQVRVENIQGNQVTSDPLTLNVRQPDPLNRTQDFVYQTFLDLLLPVPSQEVWNFYTNRIESGDLSRDRFIRELIAPAEGQASTGYDAVRGVLLANRLLLGVWPARQQLAMDAGTVSDGGLTALVTSLMPVFEPIYTGAVGAEKLPTILSSDGDIDDYVSYLFGLKYGALPDEDNQRLGRLLFKSTGRDVYTASFIEDVQLVATSTRYISLGMGFKFPLESPPSVSIVAEADAASLLINLLRIDPSDEAVTTLSEKLFAAQVSEILADPRYAARFQTAFRNLEHHAQGWKHSEWFGWFNTAYEPWIYHAEQGWVSFTTVGQTEENFWYYDSIMGWNWTHGDMFPVLYNQTDDCWMMSIQIPEPVAGWRSFYNFDTGEALWIER